MQSAVDTVKAAVAKIDPRQPDWEIPSLEGKTAIVTGGNTGIALSCPFLLMPLVLWSRTSPVKQLRSDYLRVLVLLVHVFFAFVAEVMNGFLDRTCDLNPPGALRGCCSCI